ncbi:putative ATP-grasp-modified RiPP [Kribbella sp. NBC_01505]|uniref:putative ATP-grasp-modified RiPP n=1 Tax=Kribbella sp. NBC_01505 TaxID=2903580 RepID=UPI003866F2AA
MKMYRYADRFPVSPSARVGTSSQSPWGLRRLEPYGSIGIVEENPAGVDPATQQGLYELPNGTIVVAPGKHSKSRVGTERSTKTSNKSDGSGPRPDTDHKQDTRID